MRITHTKTTRDKGLVSFCIESCVRELLRLDVEGQPRGDCGRADSSGGKARREGEAAAKIAGLLPTFRCGSYVVTASGDRTARAWDGATGQPISPPLKHDGVVDHAVFAPDGRALVTIGHSREHAFVSRGELVADNRPATEILAFAELCATRCVDPSGTVVRLKPEELMAMAKEWSALRRH